MNGIVRVLAAAAVLSAVLGCDRAPRVRTFATVAGDYVVVERNGQPLPHTLPWDSWGPGCTSTLVRLVMTLRDDGTWLEDGDARRACPGEPPRPEPTQPGDSSPYTLRGSRGDTLDLFPDGSGAYLTAQGAFDGDEIHLVIIDIPRADTTRYRYVRQPRRD